MSTTDQPPKPKRRWNQFSLRTLLVVMTLFTVTVSGFGSRMHRARKNRDRVEMVAEAVAAIEKLGGVVTIEHVDRRTQTWLEEQLDDPGPSNDPVRILHVNVANLVLSDITDFDLENLNTLTNYASLDLNGKSLTQADLEHLKEAANRARGNRGRVVVVEKTAAEIEIEKLGGRVEHGYVELRPRTWSEKLFNDPGGADDPVSAVKVTGVSLDHVETTDAGLEHLRGLTKLKQVSVTYCNVTDAGLKHLKGLTSLERLTLTETNVTDAGLEHLKGLKSLLGLSLEGTNVTDAGLKHLKSLTNLQALSLQSANVTDAGLEHIKGLSRLDTLFLGGTHVSDAGLQHLKGMPMLQFLSLWGTKVTTEGVRKLRQALPNCTSHR